MSSNWRVTAKRHRELLVPCEEQKYFLSFQNIKYFYSCPTLALDESYILPISKAIYIRYNDINLHG
jgi:hypothetical protein